MCHLLEQKKVFYEWPLDPGVTKTNHRMARTQFRFISRRNRSDTYSFGLPCHKVLLSDWISGVVRNRVGVSWTKLIWMSIGGASSHRHRHRAVHHDIWGNGYKREKKVEHKKRHRAVCRVGGRKVGCSCYEPIKSQLPYEFLVTRHFTSSIWWSVSTLEYNQRQLAPLVACWRLSFSARILALSLFLFLLSIFSCPSSLALTYKAATTILLFFPQ